MPTSQSVTPDNFKTLLYWLDPDIELAAQKYEKLRQRLIRIFVGRGCHDAELLADRTIDRVTAKVSQLSHGYVGEPAAYFYGVANKIHLEWLRAQKREREVELIDLAATPEEEEDREFSCLESCLQELPSSSREMILEYYRDEKRAKIERRRRLATRLGISIGALQIRASRIRATLYSCVTECVAGSG